MAINRRTFLKAAGSLAALAAVSGPGAAASGKIFGQTGVKPDHDRHRRSSGKKFELEWDNFTGRMKYTFSISSSSRDTTPIVLTRLSWDGITGYGEASMPPYLGESQESADAFLKRVRQEVLPRFNDPFRMEEILSEVDSLSERDAAAKASVDIALHDLCGKIAGLPWWKIWGFNPDSAPCTSFTIGYDPDDDTVLRKTREASWAKVLKVKLGRGDTEDRRMIRLIRSVNQSVPIYIDANQGWKDREYVTDMIGWLKEQGVTMIEQPMAKSDLDSHAWIRERSPLPIIADESCQRLADIPRLRGAFDGINIKLMKCTGMREAREMVSVAEALGMRLMMGCMTETSVAISAAAQLAPKMEWADLDGNLLLANDCFTGMKLDDGRITLPEGPGIGAVPLTV